MLKDTQVGQPNVENRGRVQGVSLAHDGLMGVKASVALTLRLSTPCIVWIAVRFPICVPAK